MTEKVVGLRDRAVPANNGAEPEIVSALEEALALARQGDLIALAMIQVRGNLAIGSVVRNPRECRHLLTAGAAYLLRDMAEKESTI